jgi:benzylsuccinate CoA-transferase BbsF subunit
MMKREDTDRSAGRLPLEGIRVIELATAWAGPVAARFLADMGAEVIKIENPERPDFSRGWPPFAEGVRGINRNGYYATYNRGKKGCALDLKEARAIDTVKRLAGISDVLIQNFAPGVLDRMGLGYKELRKIKPDFIMVSLSGFGATGPDSDALAFGPILEPYAGLSMLMGYPADPPLPCGLAVSDHISGTLAALAALFALHHRSRTGKGQHIDLSEVEALLACMPEAVMEYTMNRRNPRPRGNHDEVMAPHGCYRCRGDDRWVAIAIETDEEWRSLCAVMGRPELGRDTRFGDGFQRWKHRDELDSIVSAWTAAGDGTELMHTLQGAGIAAGAVSSGEELYADRQLRHREFLTEIFHPVTGQRELPGLFARLSETPGRIRSHDPLLGEHNEWLLDLLSRRESP